jgi:hypothetical protein
MYLWQVLLEPQNPQKRPLFLHKPGILLHPNVN